MQQRSLKKYLDTITIWMLQLHNKDVELYKTINSKHEESYHMILGDELDYLDDLLETMLHYCEIAEQYEFCSQFIKMKELIHKKHSKKTIN